MARISLYDLLGVADAVSPRDEVLARWPLDVVQAGIGRQESPDTSAVAQLIVQLDAALTFRDVRPGAAADRVGVIADVQVHSPLPLRPLALTRMPDVGFNLVATGTEPARLYVTSGPAGTAFVIDSLPVEIQLPARMLMPLEPPDGQIPLQDTLIDTFQPGRHDTLTITLRRYEPSSIKVHVTIRYTEAREVIIEPAVPISVGPCRFSGLPARGVHDLGFVPYATLAADPYAAALGLEWTRHPLVPVVEFEPTGFLTVRTVDFDDQREPFKRLVKAPNDQRPDGQRVEVVLEDLAMPMNALEFPVPTHFTVGLRRQLGLVDDPGSAFDLSGLPVRISLPDPSNVLGQFLIVEQLLFRSVRFADPNAADAQVAFAKLLISDDPAGRGESATINVTDGWTVEAGWRHDPGVALFELFGVNVRLLGVRGGFSIQRLTDDTEVYGLEDVVVLVGDIELIMDGAGDPDVALRPTLGDSKIVVVRDFGWRLGSFSIGQFWDPEGAELVAFDSIRLHLDEYGFVAEPGGGRYFALSASLPLGTEAVKPKPGDATPPDKDSFKHAGGGLRLHRLRTKIAGPAQAPQTLLDGITLGFREGRVQITGSGMLGDYVLDGVRYREFGIGAQIRIDRENAPFVVGAAFFHGRAAGPGVDFRYLLIGAQVSPIPLGAVTLANVQALFAWNLAPQIGELDAGAAQPMRLFQWYRAHDRALVLPPTRNMSTGGWAPLDESWTVAAGADVLIGGAKFVTVRGFFMYRKTSAGRGLLAAVEVYPFKAKKPVAYGALELDGDRWSLLIGLSIGTENLIGKKVPIFEDVPFLTGTIYMTNKPGTLAVGHVADPASWLSFHVGGHVWVFDLQLYAGVCLELVDLPEGPRVLALRVSVSGGSRVLKVGRVEFYLTLEAVVGTWRNESNVSGFVVWFEGGIEIDVFWVFDFGASVRVEWSYLGPEPAYRRMATELRIHTPWWLPDVTFRWSKTLGEPALGRMRVVSTPLVAASARELARGEAVPIAVSPLLGAVIDEAGVYSFDELAGATGQWPAGATDGVVPIATDSVLALQFKPSVDDRIAWGQNTPDGMGTQRSNDVSARYVLVALGIRRRPRFGGGGWSPLLDEAASRLDPSLLALPPEQLPPRFASPVCLRWDADLQREQRLDPRQLLVNTETPYLWVLANLEADENLVRSIPGWPCCGPGRKPRWHTLDFTGTPAGTRAPVSQRFTDSASTLNWIGGPPPLVRPPVLVPTARAAARVEPARRDPIPFARINFDTLAHSVRIDIYWRALHLRRRLVVMPFRGLKPLPAQEFPLSAEHLTTIALHDPAGISHVLLRLVGEPVQAVDDLGWLELSRLAYRSVDEALDDLVTQGRCDPPGQANPAGARFAWLANHEYEVTLTTQVAVQDERAGTLVRELPQKVFFRTKGLPGLNLVERTGQELDPYVESVYPAPATMLYRRESTYLTFNDRFDMFAALDRPHAPGDPPEREQALDLLLCVERVGGRGAVERLSQSGPDWIVLHRGTVPPAPPRPPKIIDVDPVLHRQTRTAASLDPLAVRFEAVLASPGGCGIPPRPRRSRVLAHDPVDLDAPAGAPGWTPLGVHRVNVRRKGSPFVARVPFADGDETAFSWSGAGSSRIDAGSLEIAADGDGRRYGVFGDPSWEHFQLRVRVTPGAGTAGVAVGLDGPPAMAGMLLALLDAGELVLVERSGGGEQELRRIPLPAPADGVWLLEVESFDDAVRVRVGDAAEAVPKGVRRAGRVALVAQGTVRFDELVVDGLDAFRFEFTASRYADFAAHIGSWRGPVLALPALAAPERTPAELVSAIAAGTGPPDAIGRQQLFDEWAAALAVPFSARVDRLEISARRTGDDTELLLLESPEPLPIGGDVTLTLWQLDGAGTETAVATAVLLDGSQCRALIVPDAPALPPGRYRAEFTIDRPRFRSAVPDGDSRLRQQASLDLVL